MGYDHTPLLGIIEVGAGALLILFSLRPGGRWFVAVLGLALVLGGLLVLAEVDWTVEKLGAESSYACGFPSSPDWPSFFSLAADTALGTSG